MKSLFIYNLFPRLYKNIGEWSKSLDKIEDMGFNSVFINPFNEAGFSGSLYAVKNYYTYNKNFFLKGKSEEEQIKDFIEECKKRKLEVVMDLVINHTAKDCILTGEHKNWYILNEKDELVSPGAWQDGNWVTWGDLASLNIESSPDRENLWEYLYEVVLHYAKLGITGFRCDAAYQVISEFWVYLISKIKKEFSNIYFLAETLGCTPIHIQSLSTCGFDYIFNSSKWWNFEEEWCLEQYDLTRNIAPSVSFPESHDTERLMKEVKGNKAHFLQRLYFSAVFSKGFMITSGFEYGFQKRLNTVYTNFSDWEKTNLDFTENIKSVLDIKKSLLPLKEESAIEVVPQSGKVFCFTKEWEGKKVLICINKDVSAEQPVNIENPEDLLGSKNIKDYSPEGKISGNIKSVKISLLPGEVKIFAGESQYSK
jgi:hypothetical protein